MQVCTSFNIQSHCHVSTTLTQCFLRLLLGQAGGWYTHPSAGFLGACMPHGLLLHTPGTVAQLRGPGGAALQRLAAEGLAWVPTGGSLCTLLCFALSLALNSQYSQVGPLLRLFFTCLLLWRGLAP